MTVPKIATRRTKPQSLPVVIVDPSTVEPTQVSKKLEKKPVNYLNGRDLYDEVAACKATGVMSDKLARMLQLLCAKLAKKGNFVNYSYNSDMQSYAMMMLVRTWKGFDPEKSTQAFSWFTQCAYNSFVQYLKREDQQHKIRDLVAIKQGLAPSFGFVEDEETGNIVDEGEFEVQQQQLIHQRSQLIHADVPIERDDKGEEIQPSQPE